jgi:hypothetical protein
MEKFKMTSINLDLSGKFNHFAGKEIAVTEVTHTTKYGPIVEARLDKSNPVVDELKKAVEDMGLRLRLWLPGTAGTMEFRMDRLNVHVSKAEDGKYRIDPKFNIG